MSNILTLVGISLLFLLRINESNSESFTSIVTNRTERNKKIQKFIHPPDHDTTNLLTGKAKSQGDYYDVNVGSFRIVYTAPDAPEPSYDESDEAFFLTYNYLNNNLYSLGFSGGGSVGYGFSYESEPNSDPKLIIEVYDFILSFYNDEPTVTATDIFEVITSLISNNQTYLDLIHNELIGTPFELVTVVGIDNYREGTLYPTWAPYPTPAPVPYPTPSPFPVLPAVLVPLGNASISYTSPGAYEPSDDDFYAIVSYTYFYFLDVVQYAFGSNSVSVWILVDKIDYEYIDPVATPNIITNFENMTVSFTDYGRNIPTVAELTNVLIESLNATYVDNINALNGGVFGTVIDVTMEFGTNIPTASPTKSDDLLTEAPIPKSRRGRRKPT